MNVEQKTNWLDNQLGNLPELMCYRKHKKIQVIIIIYDDVCVCVCVRVKILKFVINNLSMICVGIYSTKLYL